MLVGEGRSLKPHFSVLRRNLYNSDECRSRFTNDKMFSVGKLGKIVFGLAKTGLLNQECEVDEQKIGNLRT